MTSRDKRFTKASQHSDAELEWVWAYQESLRWLDAFDAWFIKVARGQAIEAADWQSFMTEYQLKQGPATNAFREFRVAALAIVRGKLRNLKRAQNYCEIAPLWIECVQEFYEFVQSEGGEHIPQFAYSHFSKLIWFHAPQACGMFDRLAKVGLRRWLNPNEQRRPQMSHTAFAECFEQFHEQSLDRGRIEFAASYSNRTYPYERRITDKVLWLNGSGKKAQILGRFKRGLMLADIERRAT